MTELMYTKYPDLFELSAQVTEQGSDAKGMYLVLNQSLFYPQGGGQSADQGKIITTKLSLVNSFSSLRILTA